MTVHTKDPLYETFSDLMVLLNLYGKTSAGRTWAVSPADDGLKIIFDRNASLKARCQDLSSAFQARFFIRIPQNLPGGGVRMVNRPAYDPAKHADELRALWPEAKQLSEAMMGRPLDVTDSRSLNMYYQAAKAQFQPN